MSGKCFEVVSGVAGTPGSHFFGPGRFVCMAGGFRAQPADCTIFTRPTVGIT
jgi:hypothetical protein